VRNFECENFLHVKIVRDQGSHKVGVRCPIVVFVVLLLLLFSWRSTEDGIALLVHIYIYYLNHKKRR
jgi:Ca2+/Na+ antiporter